MLDENISSEVCSPFNIIKGIIRVNKKCLKQYEKETKMTLMEIMTVHQMHNGLNKLMLDIMDDAMKTGIEPSAEKVIKQVLEFNNKCLEGCSKQEKLLNDRTQYIHLNYLNAYLIQILCLDMPPYIIEGTDCTTLGFVSQIMDGIRKLKEADEAKRKIHEN
jgi:hypothetical protein